MKIIHTIKPDDGFFVVKKGLTRSDEVGKIVSYNEAKMMDKWNGDPCNTINGTGITIYVILK